ncbi:MAG: hypothetical protein KME13_12160 [Myxacorys californica WJT36-NPBG1]|nr:hypothetical protein [Myxacorys californica WJT36-NPBG1]
MLTCLMRSWIRTGTISALCNSVGIAALVTTSLLSSPAMSADRNLGKLAAQTSTSGLPIVRSSILQPNLRVPWSQPVRVIDPFEGESLAVFDQNYFPRSFRNTNSQVKVVSLWKPDSVRVLLAYSGRECAISSRHNFGGLARHSFPFHRRLHASRFGYYPFGYFYDDFPDSICVANNGVQKITELSVKAGDRVFQLQNKNGQFPINPELATALRNAPQNVQLRAIADNGEVVDSAIGQGTVKAWRSIY